MVSRRGRINLSILSQSFIRSLGSSDFKEGRYSRGGDSNPRAVLIDSVEKGGELIGPVVGEEHAAIINNSPNLFDFRRFDATIPIFFVVVKLLMKR